MNDIESPGEDDDADGEDDVHVFSGDFFGDYEEVDFDWPDEGGMLSARYVFKRLTYRVQDHHPQVPAKIWLT
jgi:hypothetical protein